MCLDLVLEQEVVSGFNKICILLPNVMFPTINYADELVVVIVAAAVAFGYS